MSIAVGISGARRNACAALAVGGTVEAVCQQERLSRIHRQGLTRGRFPSEALTAVLKGHNPDEIDQVAIAEDIELPSWRPVVKHDHHFAHAATAFLTSSLSNALVFVCDENGQPEISLWKGNNDGLTNLGCGWHGPAFARLYSQCCEAFGLAGQEHRLEALARVGQARPYDRLELKLDDRTSAIRTPSAWRARLEEQVEHARTEGGPAVANLAATVQDEFGRILLDLVRRIRSAAPSSALCLGGGLFYNTAFTTLIRNAALYDNVFVPINPGNAGLAVGLSLLANSAEADAPSGHPVSPFLGPRFSSEEIKAVLENCKLTYTRLDQTDVIDVSVRALRSGQIVGWFEGGMEWGPRALGGRSILADPTNPYVLENLNKFLKHREPHRAYSLSALAHELPSCFASSKLSPFMEFEYPVSDERLNAVLPTGASQLRVQTLEDEHRSFSAIHRAMKQETGLGVLVNTSFNGLHEPIVCSPRDAVRVFFGTGLDMLVMDRFVVRK